MMSAAAMGATAFMKGLGAIHALSHPIGAFYNSHHGTTNESRRLIMDKLRYFFKEFLPEVKSEWKKVTKPSRKEVTQTTTVVVVTSFIFAFYLWFADIIIQRVYEGLFSVLGL